MTNKDIELLQQAIARNVGVVLSLPSAGMLRHHKSRFLSETDEGIVVEAPAGEESLIADLIATGKPAGISFKHAQKKSIFAVPILKILRALQLNGDTTVDAILIARPQEVKSIQRRSDYRVSIVPDDEIIIRIWRIGDRVFYKDQPLASQEVKAQLRNLSTGGAGVQLFGKDNQPPKIDTEDRLRVQLSARDQILILEGRMRGPGHPGNDNSINTGIQFKKIEDDLYGRKMLATLTRLIGELQREEIRRMRLGLTMVG
ncbi:MAG: hypothetical protein ABSF29_16015 [Tepidisphaeraceae bacterium]|jgi:c-di-GMP-binding flagellar brake protein YcgR